MLASEGSSPGGTEASTSGRATSTPGRRGGWPRGTPGQRLRNTLRGRRRGISSEGSPQSFALTRRGYGEESCGTTGGGRVGNPSPRAARLVTSACAASLLPRHIEISYPRGGGNEWEEGR